MRLRAIMRAMLGIDGEKPRGSPVDRAQSSVIGVVLVVAITVIGVTGVLVFGTGALEDARSQSEVDAAEHAMTQLDSRFSLVALGAAKYQGSSVPLRSGSDMRVDGDAGWINVSVVNRTTGALEDEILNESLGAVIYENDGTTIAYQGGGVWKRTSGGSVMVSPPEFHYRTRSGEDPTLTLPIVVVRGEGSVGEDATVKKDATIAEYPVPGDPTRTNPLEEGEINVTVHSAYYRAWGSFFEERTGGTVSYDHDEEEVTITLVIDDEANTIVGGVVSGATNELLIRKHAKIDSYNSSDGPYGSGDDNNTIVSSGSVTLRKDATVEGNLTAGGSVTLKNGATVTGKVTEEADVSSPRSVGWLIDQRREEIMASPDSSPCIDPATDELGGCSPPYTLDEGEYYLDEMDLGGNTLVLDTSTNNVTVVVDGDMDIENSKIEVNGPHTARFYVEGDLAPKNSNVSVVDDRSPLLWIYMNPGSRVDMFSQAEFVGVVYGPGNGAEDGVDITLKNEVEIYGSLVGELTEGIDQKQDVHYDEALVQEDPLTGYGDDQPKVTYMHVTVNAVNVTSR